MTVRSLVQSACWMLSIPPPTIVNGNASDDMATHLLHLSNEEGRSLARRHNWQALTKEHTFTTVATAAQTDSIPTDFDRMIPETMFNRTSLRRVYGPLSSEEWQAAQASSVVYINPTFRIRDDTIYMSPTPSAGDTVAYEYVSENWCETSGGTGLPAWVFDSDVGILPEDLMALGLVWRFKQARGMDFQADYQMYETRVRDAILRDGSRPRLSAAPVVDDRVPRAPIMPETFTIS